MDPDLAPPAEHAPVPLDWLLLGRYALLISLCALIPVPIVDTMIENALRRRLVRAIGRRHGHTFEPPDAARLGDAPSGGCLGLVWAVVSWPVKKVLKTLSVVFQVKGIADTLSEVMHRGLMLEEAFESGWLPGDAGAVRQAMDTALRSVDTRPVERTLMGSLRDLKSDLNLAIWETVRIARARLTSRAADALADAADTAAVGPGIAQTSRAMAAALRTSALVPELLAWFRAEMGAPPRVEPKLFGPIEAELVPAEASPEGPLLTGSPTAIEDAVEVPGPVSGRAPHGSG